MSVTEWFGLFVAGATAIGLKELIAKVIDLLQGRSGGEKARVREFIAERNAANEETECLRDYVNMYREQIGDLGGGIVPRPGWPCVPYKSNVMTIETPPAAEKDQ